MKPTAYSLENLEHEYQGSKVLDIESLAIAQGSILGLAGPNGSGKSTLLRLLAFIEEPTGGKIFFQGRAASDDRRRLRRKVALLLQNAYLLKRSVHQNLVYGLAVRNDRADWARRVDEALKLVGLEPVEYRARDWRRLSGGEAQRVALAARLILKPEVLLLDEPTASLDTASAAMVMEAALRARREWGATLVVASHDLLWLKALADRVVTINKGQLVREGHQTILPGPWSRDQATGMMATTLPEGQRILARAPAKPLATGGVVAALGSENIRLHKEPPRQDGGVNLLRGQVAQITLEKAADGYLIQVIVDRVPFTLKLGAEQSPPLPGRKVYLEISPEDIFWL